MTFPASPTDKKLYTAPNGTVYRYVAADNKWIKPNEQLIYDPWTPDQLGAALEQWQDASDAATITHSSGSVSNWADKSGNGYDLEQPTGSKQPTWDEVDTITVLGSGGNGFQQSGTATGVYNHSVMNLFYVNNCSDNAYIFVWGSPSHFGFCGQDGSTGFPTSNFGASPELWVDGVEEIISTRDDVHTATGQGVDQIVQEIGDTTAASWQGVLWMNYTDTATFDMATTVKEIVVVSGAMSVSDRQKMEGYLAHKWGLEGNLPAGHPYLSAPPV